MKRILFSFGLIVLVGAAAYGSTGAFFSDTETSAANIFTAGSIDLTIDHSLSTYNGGVVTTSLTVVSDPQTTFVGNNTLPANGNAVNLSFVHPGWTAPITGAHWIWATDPVSQPTVNQTYTFTRTFNWSGAVTAATIEFAADNYFDVYINGTLVGTNHNLIVDNFEQAHLTNIQPYVISGLNTITFVAENEHVDGSNAAGNPAGVIFKAVIQGPNTWTEAINLSGQPIWSFDDVKPQDQGRDVLSLHVDTNDAWSCMQIGGVTNNENSLIEPETTAGDVGPANGPNGELGQYLALFLWHDVNHDGVYNPGPETFLGTGNGIYHPFVGPGTTTIPVRDSTTAGGPQAGGSTDYVGAAWCAGTIAVDGGGAITCDGTPVSNAAQTDSTTANVAFYATQSRNNVNFTCAGLDQQNP